MVTKIHICFHPLCNSSQTPFMEQVQSNSQSSSKSKHDNNTNYDIDRQCRDAKGNGYQHIQKETANEDRECQPKWTKTVPLTTLMSKVRVNPPNPVICTGLGIWRGHICSYILAYLTFVWPSCTEPSIYACSVGFCKTTSTAASQIY